MLNWVDSIVWCSKCSRGSSTKHKQKLFPIDIKTLFVYFDALRLHGGFSIELRHSDIIWIHNVYLFFFYQYRYHPG